MSIVAPVHSKPSLWQVTLGAEGIAAAQFARYGFDVSVQSGPYKPRYDLVVAKAGHLLKVSVMGSEDGIWALTQSYLKRAGDLSRKKADCHGAIDQWLDHNGSLTVCCLVQFQGVPMDELPRMYLATPKEVARKLRETVDRLGSSWLYEEYAWTSGGEESSVIERLPSAWRFSHERLQEMLALQGAGIHLKPLPLKIESSAITWPGPGILPLDGHAALAAAATS
jgi:hypothetical protein